MDATKDEYQNAESLHTRIVIMYDDYLSALKSKDALWAQDRAARIRGSVPPGLYEHWKSKNGDAKFYAVEGAGIEQDTERPVVAYRSLYGDRAGELTFRHLLDKEFGFLTPIDRLAHPYRGPRFRLVEPLTLRQIADILDYVGRLTMMTDPVLIRMFIAEVLKKKVPMW